MPFDPADAWRLSICTYAEILSKGKWQAWKWLRYVAAKIEDAIANGNGRVIVNAPPQFGKSSLVSHWLPIWYLDMWPENRIILTSYSDQLATDCGRGVRDELVGNPLCWTKVREDKDAAGNWVTPEGGGLFATSIGGGITGRGGNLILVDDATKNWEKAQSALERRRVVDWFKSTLYTRRQPSATIIVIQCMVGSTQVSMANGSLKPLRDVRAGDFVATYDKGKRSVAVVSKWANQGLDCVFTIKTISGTCTANARHPFLVERGGTRQWVRLRDLKIGDRLVRMTAAGVNGAVSPAFLKGANCLPSVEDSVTRITTKTVGAEELDRRPPTPNLVAERILDTATESILENTVRCSQGSKGYALFANNRPEQTCARIGEGNSASIMIMRQIACGGFSATTAISPSATGKQKQRSQPPLDMFGFTLEEIIEITDAGHEEVFDLQVERTENFIADGFVSHNTRWHEDDLAGWLVRDHEDDWQHISLPALAEANDPLGRAEGESLCPERFTREELLATRKGVAEQVFSGLYQQRPAPAEGGVIKRTWWRYWEQKLEGFDRLLMSWDMTFKSTGSSWVVGQVWGRKGPDVFLLDQLRDKLDFPATLAAVRRLAERWPDAKEKLIEDAANGPAVISVLRKEIPGIIPVPARGSKESRLAAIAPFIESGNVYLPSPRVAPWVDGLVEEVTMFPNGANDDQVDAATQAISRLFAGPTKVLRPFNLANAGQRVSPWEQ